MEQILGKTTRGMWHCHTKQKYYASYVNYVILCYCSVEMATCDDIYIVVSACSMCIYSVFIWPHQALVIHMILH